MFELPTVGQCIVATFATGLAYWIYKTDKDESQKRKVRHQEEKVLMDNIVDLTTTCVKFERHLWSILDKVASLKLQSVIITDEKEIPQSVLISYSEYKILQLRCNKNSSLLDNEQISQSKQGDIQ